MEIWQKKFCKYTYFDSSGCDINGCPVAWGKLKIIAGTCPAGKLIFWLRHMIFSIIYTFSSCGQVSQLCGQVHYWCNLPGGQVLKNPNVTPCTYSLHSQIRQWFLLEIAENNVQAVRRVVSRNLDCMLFQKIWSDLIGITDSNPAVMELVECGMGCM